MEQAKRQRRQTQCANCQETFALGYPLTAGQDEKNLVINTRCPFCDSNLRIELRAFLKPTVDSYKSINNADQADTVTPDTGADTPLVIPEEVVLPTVLLTEGDKT